VAGGSHQAGVRQCAGLHPIGGGGSLARRIPSPDCENVSEGAQGKGGTVHSLPPPRHAFSHLACPQHTCAMPACSCLPPPLPSLHHPAHAHATRTTRTRISPAVTVGVAMLRELDHVLHAAKTKAQAHPTGGTAPSASAAAAAAAEKLNEGMFLKHSPSSPPLIDLLARHVPH
jgi:hypothetical protein